MKHKTMEVNTARSLLLLSNIYDEPYEPLAQLIENSIDACHIMATEYNYEGYQPNIWIILNPNSIEVIDNGHGLVSDILEEDNETIEATSTEEDIRRLISKSSLRSLEWMMHNIAFSSKLPSDQLDIKGMRGIGILSYLQMGEGISIITKPFWVLYQEHTGKQVDGEDQIPIYILKPPTADALRHQRLDYVVDQRWRTNPVTDPWSIALTHGLGSL